MTVPKYLTKINALKRLKLRARKVKGGYSLYLDTILNGHRERLTLKIEISNVKDKMFIYAVALRDRKELELLQDQNGFRLYRQQVVLTDYFKQNGTTANRGSVQRYIDGFYIGRKIAGEISESDIRAWKDYLLEHISPMTAKTYLQILRTCFNKAVREQLITSNPCDNVHVKAKAARKEFLNLEELKKLVGTPCRNEEVKRAFIFSCLTGIRFSDLNRITKHDINDNILTFRQQKTQDVISVPLNEKARQIAEMTPSVKLFTLPSIKTYLKILKSWVKAADITKKVTSHVGRVSFATMLLSNNVSSYTVSQLLGHRSLTSITPYANLVDQKRVDAIKLLPL